MSEIILHIGDHKTGTTSIQQALARFATTKKAQAESLLFCQAGRGRQSAHNNLAWQAKGAKYFAPARGGWSDVADEIRKTAPRQVVLSSETFEFVSPARLREIIKSSLGALNYRLRIIAYVRPHFSSILSRYSQKVKTGQFVGTLDEFVEKTSREKRFAFAERLASWASAFEDGQFLVRPFVRELLVANDVLADFCVHGLGRAPEFLRPYAGGKSNASPSGDVLRIITGYAEALGTHENSDLASRCEAMLFSRLRGKLEPLYPSGDAQPVFSPPAMRRVIAAYGEDAKNIDTRFFAGKKIFQNALESAAGKEAGNRGQCQVGAMNPRELSIHKAYLDVIAELVSDAAWFKNAATGRRTPEPN